MKSIVTVLLMSAVLAVSGVLYMNKLNGVSEELIKINEEVREEIQNSRFDTASAKIDELYGFLEKEERYFEAFGDHAEIDNIEMTLSELDEYTASGSMTDALAKSKVLDFLFKHMPKNYRLKFENIL